LTITCSYKCETLTLEANPGLRRMFREEGKQLKKPERPAAADADLKQRSRVWCFGSEYDPQMRVPSEI